ncbi:MAG: thioredoxin family protein [Chromatiaceae bacterium]|nr:MAG: thioredoxin family protein [Chromatiaceae bacterium]
MKLQILGSGCAKCNALAQHSAEAANALGLDYELEKITDMNAIIDAGVMSTPALAVDGEVKSAGRLLSVEEIKRLLSA